MSKKRTTKKAAEKVAEADVPAVNQPLPAPPSEPKDAQVRKERALAGIEFDDDEAVADPRDPVPEEKPPERTAETDAANQEAAKRAIERMSGPEEGRPIRKPQPPKPSAPDPEHQEAIRPRIYRVLRDSTITRGAASYVLKAGKPITDRDYNIESLKQQGVQLEEIKAGA